MQIDATLTRHFSEIDRLMSRRECEHRDGKILFPAIGACLSGEYFDDEGTHQNMITDEGFVYLLNVGLKDATKNTAWYLALYGNDYAPTKGLTAATFPATAGEITSLTEGYTETTRRAWISSTPVVSGDYATIDNTASRAEFTIATASSLSIRGIALLSNNVKGSASGVCLSAMRYPNARVKYAGEVFMAGYRLRLRDMS